MMPTITDILFTIQENQASLGITLLPGATDEVIEQFETTLKLKLPDDFKTFYKYCNGFKSQEDIFNIIPLEEIINNGQDPVNTNFPTDFFIAEYMIYSDMWIINIDADNHNIYTIYNKGIEVIVLTNSLAEFLSRFIEGGVFGGLYPWGEEILRK